MADGLATTLAILATILVIAPLVAIFAYLVYKGARSLNVAFFTQLPKPPGELGGGMANAMLARRFCWRWPALSAFPSASAAASTWPSSAAERDWPTLSVSRRTCSTGCLRS
jgi:ABC-type phosphate transport system permease subunit